MVMMAITFAAVFLGTMSVGRVWLAHREIKARAQPPKDIPCDMAARQEEADAWAVLAKARELFPELDLEMMRKQVHP